MVKEFFIHAILILTLLSGLLSILAAIGWVLGAEDGKLILLFSGSIFLPCAVIICFIKDGWKRLLGEMLFIPWPF